MPHCLGRVLLVVNTAVTAFAWPALAEPADVAGQATAADARAAALELFERSVALYERGDFQGCASLLERAYATYPEPVLLYNLGRAYQGLDELEKAVAVYSRYLAVDAEVKDRAAIEQRIVTLRAELDARAEKLREKRAAEALADRERKRPTSSPPKRLESPTPRSKPSAVPAWATLGTGVAALGAGVTLGLLAQSTHESAVRDPEGLHAWETQNRAERLAVFANVALIGGAALAGGGALWLVLVTQSGATSADSSRAALLVGPSSMQLRVKF